MATNTHTYLEEDANSHNKTKHHEESSPQPNPRQRVWINKHLRNTRRQVSTPNSTRPLCVTCHRNGALYRSMPEQSHIWPHPKNFCKKDGKHWEGRPLKEAPKDSQHNQGSFTGIRPKQTEQTNFGNAIIVVVDLRQAARGDSVPLNIQQK